VTPSPRPATSNSGTSLLPHLISVVAMVISSKPTSEAFVGDSYVEHGSATKNARDGTLKSYDDPPIDLLHSKARSLR
jgi:hypothetical protein